MQKVQPKKHSTEKTIKNCYKIRFINDYIGKKGQEKNE